MAGERILVIDDSQDIRDILRDLILGPRGYKVITANDGRAGLDMALRERPDLILMDVNMPNMTGLEVLEKLREAKYNLPVVLMTFHGSESIAVQAFRLGVHDYIRKPFEVEEVLTVVNRALIESRLRREREELLKRLEMTNRQLKRRLTDLGTLYAIGQAVTSLLDLDKLLNRVVEASVYLCRADEGMLYLVDKESGDLYMTAAQGVGEKTAHRLRVRAGGNFVRETLRTGKPVILTSQKRLKVTTGYLVHSLINVPLKVKGETIGVLSVTNRVRRRDFTGDDVARLTALANYAAIAIENARLYQETRKVVAAEVLNNTIVTISHYINNPLMALTVSMDRLRQACKKKQLDDPSGLVVETVRFTEMKVEEIASVIAILRDMASPQLITYMDDIKMLDIETKVKEQLQRIEAKYQG